MTLSAGVAAQVGLHVREEPFERNRVPLLRQRQGLRSFF